MNEYDDLKKLFNAIITKKKVGHAFLFNVDDSYDTSLAINFIKEILKNDIIDVDTDDSQYEKFSYQLDNNIFPDLMIIKSFDKVIKKEQILNIKAEMKEKSINSGKQFYIIEYAENLNSSSANALLKFLEEPDDEIIAILVTKNINKVISTIVSRCQIVNLNHYNRKKDEQYFELALKYLLVYEDKKEKAVSYLSELYEISSDDLKGMINSWIYIYKNVLKLLLNKDSEETNNESILALSKKNNIESVIDKLDKLEKMSNLILYNVNVRIILDELFI
mgnify:FL=1